MATGDSYTRLVLTAKIVLPLLALGILSTLFLLSDDIDPAGALPYAEVDVEEIAREQRLSNPRYATVDEDGASIELSAREAKPNPDDANRVDATEVAGLIGLPNGLRIELSSGGAVVDLEDQTIALVEQVLVTSTSGYRIASKQLLANMDRAELASQGPVTVETPFGDLEAGNMMLTRRDGNYRLVFNNKVKLVYRP